MGLDISFRRISCLLVVGLILLTASALANAGAALSFPNTQVTEVAKSPVVWDPTRGAGVQTITKTCASANSCSVKPVTQWIKRGSSGLGRFLRSATNPWAFAAMIGAGWVWDEVEEMWNKQYSTKIFRHDGTGTLVPYPELKSFWTPAPWCGNCTMGEKVLSYPHNGNPLYAYVYVDHYNSLGTLTGRTGTNYTYVRDDQYKEIADESDVWKAFTSHADQANSWQVATVNGQAINPWQDLFTDSSPAVNPDPLPDISPSDAALLDLLKQGLLQSTDPLAPHYVSPAELARLQALAQQMEDALNQKAEEALEAMKQPITQQQYDESNARDRAEFANALPDPNFLPDVEENLNSDIDIINETPELPTGPDLTNLWSFSTGTCNGFTLPASVAGRSYSITVDKQCDYYPEFNAALNFMLYLLTAFQIFNIYHRAMLRG